MTEFTVARYHRLVRARRKATWQCDWERVDLINRVIDIRVWGKE